jgi:hypothetical protein
LPQERAQGIASTANAREPHYLAPRFANEPSFLRDDKELGPRGLGVKIFSVSGKFLDPAGKETKIQDLTFNNAPLLELGDVTQCLEIFQIREKHFLELNKITDDLELRSDTELQMAPMQLPNHHFLAYTMYSQSAFRWGPYVAKIALFPSKDAQKNLSNTHKINFDSDIDQHRL